jgi:hypothetical protein
VILHSLTLRTFSRKICNVAGCRSTWETAWFKKKTDFEKLAFILKKHTMKHTDLKDIVWWILPIVDTHIAIFQTTYRVAPSPQEVPSCPLFKKFLLFYYSYVHTMLGSFLPPAPAPSLTIHSTPSLSFPPPQYPAETILSLSLILLKREYKQ